MSTKTNFKRVALVAVASLGLGVLTSVAPANAAIGAATIDATLSRGVIATLSGSGASIVGTLSADGLLTLDIATGTTTLVVTGGTYEGIASTTGTSLSQLPGTNAVGITAGALADVKFKPTAAGTNMVINSYAAANIGAIGGVTASETITITVVPAGVSGVFSASTSLFSIQAIGSATATVSDALYESAARGTEIRVNYSLKDALTAALPASTSVIGQISSGECVVGLSAGSGTLPLVAENAASGDFFVADSDTTTPSVCVLDILVGGVKRASKTLTFQGPAVSLTVTSAYRGRTSTANTGMAYITAKDSAGNTLGGLSIAVVTTDYTSVVTAASLSQATTASAVSDTGTTNATANSTPTTIGWTCSSVKGSADIRFKTTLANGSTLYSNTVKATCAGDPNTYTASLDKATYVPGDIAVLTITAKDSGGNLTNDAAVLGSGTTTLAPVATGSNLTAVTAPASADLFEDGKATYRFVVGSTEGSYNMVVDLPYWNATSTVSQKAVTVPYTIKASSTAVSNADVLKAIVSLIASINKQIAALQKALLKK